MQWTTGKPLHWWSTVSTDYLTNIKVATHNKMQQLRSFTTDDFYFFTLKRHKEQEPH